MLPTFPNPQKDPRTAAGLHFRLEGRRERSPQKPGHSLCSGVQSMSLGFTGPGMQPQNLHSNKFQRDAGAAGPTTPL